MRLCCRCRPSVDQLRWDDRLAALELMGAHHCSVESDAVRPCRHDARGGFKLALPSPLCFCSMQTCMSKSLCMCFAGAVCVMSVSSRTGEKPVWLALTSLKWVSVRAAHVSVGSMSTRCEIARDFVRCSAIWTETTCIWYILTIWCDGARLGTRRECVLRQNRSVPHETSGPTR